MIAKEHTNSFAVCFTQRALKLLDGNNLNSEFLVSFAEQAIANGGDAYWRWLHAHANKDYVLIETMAEMEGEI